MAWGAIAGLALQAIGSGVAAAMSAKANKEQQDFNKAMYNQRVRSANEQKNTNFLNTDSGQAILTEMKNEYRNALTNSANNGMKAGASAEQQLASQTAAANQYVKSMGQLGQASQQYKLGAEGQYNTMVENARNNYQQSQNKAYEQQNQSAMNLGHNAAVTGQSMMTGSSFETTNNENGEKVPFWKKW